MLIKKISGSSIFDFFGFKSSFPKKNVEQKIVCGAPCIFYSQKSLAITICGKCTIKMSSITFVFLCSISFLKVFSHNVLLA
jgi:hypothetical protein